MSRPPFFRIYTTQAQHKNLFFSPQSHEKHQDEQLHIKTEKTPQRVKEWANQRKTQHPQQKTMQEHNAERKTIGRHSRKTQHRKIAENEDRAYNNRIDTGSTEKQFLFSPFFALRDTKRYTEREIHTKEEKTSQRERKWVNG